MSYDLKPIQAPRLTGRALKAFARAVETPGVRELIAPQMLSNGGVLDLREESASEHVPVKELLPTYFKGLRMPPTKEIDLGDLLGEDVSADADAFTPVTAGALATAYREGTTTPEQVIETLQRAVKDSQYGPSPMSIFIHQKWDEIYEQAAASAKRFAENKPLGPLDGVPVSIKDEVDVRGYGTTLGTRFLGLREAEEDATIAGKLRAAGAILIGKTNMQELGMGVTGLNPHHGTPLNAHHPEHLCGGSSSGSGAALAAGFGPLSVGCDGGGSIRIPASFCGVVGLKPTLGRVSEHACGPLNWTTAHSGPMGVTTRDVALGYAVMAGVDEQDPLTIHQPKPYLRGWDTPDLKGVTLGVFEPWFEDADAEVVRGCRDMLETFEKRGATVKTITIPQLALMRAAHLVTIVSEMAASQLEHYDRYRDQYSPETRVNLAMARTLRSYDYVQAQRLRVRFTALFEELLGDVDAIVTPSTGCTAPAVPTDALESGLLDLGLLGKIMRFAPGPNLTGHPAISFPVGYDHGGLPIGMQAIGRAWDEATLLRLSFNAEHEVPRQRPRRHWEILPR